MECYCRHFGNALPLGAIMTDSFQEISIRGRLAYGVTCLESVLKHYGIKNELLDEIVLPSIWAFTSSRDLGAWDNSINKIDPNNLLGDSVIISSSNAENPLKRLYQSLPDFIVEMISNVIEIGTANLYGGTQQGSPHSLKPLKNVIQACKMNNVTLPDITPFKKSLFEEYHGWGHERERNFFNP